MSSAGSSCVPRREELFEEERVAAGARVQRLDDAVRAVPGRRPRSRKEPTSSVERRSRCRWVTACRRSSRGSISAVGCRRCNASGGTCRRAAAVRCPARRGARRARRSRSRPSAGRRRPRRSGPGVVRSCTTSNAEPHPLVGGAGAVGQDLEPVVGLRVPVERVEEELERAAQRTGVGLAREHDHAVGQPVDELTDEAGLPDAGFAPDERDGRGLTRLDEARGDRALRPRPTIWGESPGRPTSIPRA